MAQPRTLPKPVNHRQEYKQNNRNPKENELKIDINQPIPRFRLIFVFWENILVHLLLAGSCIALNSKITLVLNNEPNTMVSHLLYLFGYTQMPFVILNLQSLMQHDKKNMKINLPIFILYFGALTGGLVHVIRENGWDMNYTIMCSIYGWLTLRNFIGFCSWSLNFNKRRLPLYKPRHHDHSS